MLWSLAHKIACFLAMNDDILHTAIYNMKSNLIYITCSVLYAIASKSRRHVHQCDSVA